MATPTLSRHRLPGALGDILVDVRAGARASRRPAVVIVHGFKGFKDWGMFPPFAERCARAGFAAVSFNTSGSGVDDDGRFTLPDAFRQNTFGAELSDLQAVLAALAAGDLGVASPSSVAVVGHSRGGGVGILAAARDPRITALVTWAAIASVQRWPAPVRAQWRRDGRLDVVNARTGEVLALGTAVLDEIEGPGAPDIEGAAAAVRQPWLLVHGTADEAVPLAEGEALRAAAGGPVEWRPVEGAGHTFGAVHPWVGWPPAFQTVSEETIRWLSRHVT